MTIENECVVQNRVIANNIKTPTSNVKTPTSKWQNIFEVI